VDWNHFVDSLAKTLSAAARWLDETQDVGDVYGMVLYTSSDMNGLDVAYATRSGLVRTAASALEMRDSMDQQHAGDPSWEEKIRRTDVTLGAEVFADHWQVISEEDVHEIVGLNEDFETLMDTIDDESDDWLDTANDGLVQAVTTSFRGLAATRGLDGPSFEADLFVGLQFSSLSNVPVMVQLSGLLNSEAWQVRFLAALRQEGAVS